MDTPDLRNGSVGTASFDLMDVVLGVWGGPNQNDRINDALSEHAIRYGLPGLFGVCVASVVMATPSELVGVNATYVLEAQEEPYRFARRHPGLGTTLAQFWVAVVADDMDTAWALFLSHGGEPFDNHRLGSFVSLVIATGITNLTEPTTVTVICPHCGARSANPHDVENRYCGACHHFCDEVSV